MPSTTGTNTALTRSTRRWIGALAACADFDQADDARQHRLGADGRGLDRQRALGVDRAAGDAVARAPWRPAGSRR